MESIAHYELDRLRIKIVAAGRIRAYRLATRHHVRPWDHEKPFEEDLTGNNGWEWVKPGKVKKGQVNQNKLICQECGVAQVISANAP